MTDINQELLEALKMARRSMAVLEEDGWLPSRLASVIKDQIAVVDKAIANAEMLQRGEESKFVSKGITLEEEGEVLTSPNRSLWREGVSYHVTTSEEEINESNTK